jgi:hypothetical protein
MNVTQVRKEESHRSEEIRCENMKGSGIIAETLQRRATKK